MSHSHSHTHKVKHNKAFGFGVTLNLIYIGIEFGFGLATNSMALIADAGHNLSDVFGLLLAWGAAYLASKTPSENRTYGFRKSTILASLTNAIILMIAVGAIAVESVKRFFEPDVVDSNTIIIVAAIGVVINAITAFLFFADRDKDLNIKGAFLHMAADAGVSLGVVAGAIVIGVTNWYWIDPIISIIIIIVITFGTWDLLKESLNLSLDAVPKKISIDSVKEYLNSLPDVSDVHDLHIWAMSTTEIALTAHLVKPNSHYEDEFIEKVHRELLEKFEINHATIQIEKSDNCEDCSMHNI